MNCPKCGAPLDNDSLLCKSCGANLNENIITEQENIPNIEIRTANVHTEEAKEDPHAYVEKQSDSRDDGNKEKYKDIIENVSSVLNGKILKAIGFIAGTFFIIVGLSLVCSSNSSLRSAAFGADFYTYTYEGILEISEILVNIEKALGWAVAAIGTAIDVYVLFK